MDRKERGDRGERAATVYLEANGMRVIDRNVHCGGGEIDIVALEGETVVLVEVKARTRPGVRPAEAVTRRKMRNLSRAALVYLIGRNWLERDIRFDVVEILDGDGMEIEHIRAAFDYIPPSRF